MPVDQRYPSSHNVPWSALVALVVIVSCTTCSAAIVIIPDGCGVNSWLLRPTVLLAILSSTLNFASTLALSLGVATTWWRSASKGTTLIRLHLIWSRGGCSSIRGPKCDLLSGWDVNTVALASIVIAVAGFVNNPLLQKATQLRSEDVVTNATMMMDISRQIPDGWTGVSNGQGDQLSSHAAAIVAQQWHRNATISTRNEPGYTCNGLCEGVVQGAGIHSDCSATVQHLDFLTPGFSGVIFEINNTAPTVIGGAPTVNLTVLYVSNVNASTCIATVQVEVCAIRAATVEYPVVIQNNTIAVRQQRLHEARVISTYNSIGDSHHGPMGSPAGTLTGIAHVVSTYFGAHAVITRTTASDPRAPPYNYRRSTFFSDQYYDASTLTNSSCVFRWRCPTSDILNDLSVLMFRAALSVGNGSSTQTFTVRQTTPALVFRSNLSYLYAAVGIMSLAFLALLPLLWGWWHLERTSDLSPLEIALAFRAPLLQDVHQGASHDDIIKMVGEMRVRYDAVFLKDKVSS